MASICLQNVQGFYRTLNSLASKLRFVRLVSSVRDDMHCQSGQSEPLPCVV